MCVRVGKRFVCVCESGKGICVCVCVRVVKEEAILNQQKAWQTIIPYCEVAISNR